MKNNVLLSGTIILILLSSCNRWIAPPYTSVEKVLTVKPGMGIEQVNAALGITPYDIYHIQEDGSSVVTYKYRIKHRKMTVFGGPQKFDQEIRTERSQTEGEGYYMLEEYTLYALFNGGKLKSMISSQGRNDSEWLLLENNTIQVIAKKDISYYSEEYVKYLKTLFEGGGGQQERGSNTNSSGNGDGKFKKMVKKLASKDKKGL